MSLLRCRLILIVAWGGLSACGGSGGVTPPPATARPSASPSPLGQERLGVVLFLDEDEDGRLDSDERGRIPAAKVMVGTVSAVTSGGDGRALLAGLPAGAANVVVDPATLPPYHEVPAPIPVSLPPSADLEIAIRLPADVVNAHRYLAFGDSITDGEGSSDELGYRGSLANNLESHFGKAEVINAAAPGTTSWQGAERVNRHLRAWRPAWILIEYGTNDWNTCDEVADCPMIESLRSIIQQARAVHTLPVLATVIPANTGYLEPSGFTKAPPERNLFVAEQAKAIRALAAEEGVALADMEKAFMAEAGSNLSAYFVDHVHPNDRGYAIMVREFFRALTTPATGLRAVNSVPGVDLPSLLSRVPPRRQGPAFED